MRLASLVTLLAALTFGAAAGAQGPAWSSPTVIRTCGAPAASPHVVFPYSVPQHRSGRGAIVWVGGAPRCARRPRAGTTLDIASLHSDDTLSLPRPLWGGRGIVGPLATTTTTQGQIVVAAGEGSEQAVYGETPAGATLPSLVPLGGAPSMVATAVGYIGDADVVNVLPAGSDQEVVLRAQRHYENSFERPVGFTVPGARITALTVGMDFRADSIIVWAQGGVVYARWINNVGHVFPTRTLGPAGYAPQISAVLSDNNHAFVMWTDEPPPGSAGSASIFLVHSGNDVTFPAAPRPRVTFTEPAGQRLTPGSIGLLRQSPSEGVLAAWTSVDASGDYVVSVAGVTSGGPLPAGVISQPGTDLRLAAFAAGPRDDAVAVIETAPRAARGFDATHQSILAARTAAGGPGGVTFESPVTLAPAGVNSAPSVAIDPDTDRAVVAWQTLDAGQPAVAYAVRAAA